jgi:hypothetical protein
VSPAALFGISVVLGFVAWGLVSRQYIWPALRDRPRTDALRRILALHCFRFIGLAFLVPGVVSPDLPTAFARPAAYGNLITVILALVTLAALRSRLGIPLVWAFNLVGTADLLNAFYQASQAGVGSTPGLLGAAYFIPTFVVPLLLCTHGLVFLLLVRRTPLRAPIVPEPAGLRGPEALRSPANAAMRDRP